MNSVNGDDADGLALSGVRVLDLTHQVDFKNRGRRPSVVRFGPMAEAVSH